MYSSAGEIIKEFGAVGAFIVGIMAIPAVILSAYAAKMLLRSPHGRAGILILAVLCTARGIAKFMYGGDTGKNIVGATGVYTNDVTNIEIQFTGTGVSINDPVWVRNSERENWIKLTKINPTITTDLPTNTLAFAVNGDYSDTTYSQLWVGVNTPAVVIETTNIEITAFVASSSSVYLEWTTTDPLAQHFKVQMRTMDKRTREYGEWGTVGTLDRADVMHFSITGFLVDKTRQYRVISEYTVGE